MGYVTSIHVLLVLNTNYRPLYKQYFIFLLSLMVGDVNMYPVLRLCKPYACYLLGVQVYGQMKHFIQSPKKHTRSLGTKIVRGATLWDAHDGTPGSALLKYCKYTCACTKGVLIRTSMYKMYVQ